MINYGDDTAGQFPKMAAKRQLDNLMKVLIAVSVIGNLLIGLQMGFYLFPFIYSHFSWALRAPRFAFQGTGLILDCILLVFVWFVYKHLSDPVDEIIRQRVRYLRGAETERLVAFALQDLSDKWHLFNGIAMKGGGDIDHVLVGPGGLFCISTKGMRGTYSLAPDGRTLLLDNELCDHSFEAQQLALKLRHWLEARLDTNSDIQTIPWVQPVLVNPYAHRRFDAMANNVWVMDDFEMFGHAIDAKNKLSPRAIAACVKILQELSKQGIRPSSGGSII